MAAVGFSIRASAQLHADARRLESGITAWAEMLRHDDTVFFPLEFGSGWELAPEKFDVAACARTTVRTQQPHAIEEHKQRENFGVFERRRTRALGRLLLGFVYELPERSVKLAGRRSVRRFLVINAGAERLVRFSEGLHRGQNIRVACRWMSGGKFRGGEGHSRKRVLMRVDNVLGNLYVE